MPATPRPTLRCVNEDLTDEWDDRTHQRAMSDGFPSGPPSMTALNHPVIRHAIEVFSDLDGEHQRETISGLSDPTFYKLKTGRWRGAIFIDENNQPWLVAAGLRRAGDRDDFYADFMNRVNASGSSSVLPTAEDNSRLRRENAEGELTKWEQGVHDAILGAVARIGTDGQEKVTLHALGGDSRDVLCEVEVTIAVIEDDADAPEGYGEVVLEFQTIRWQDEPLIGRAELVAMCAIGPDEQSWKAGHASVGRIYSSDGSAAEINAMLGRALRGSNKVPGASTPGVVAHFTHEARLTEQYVEGTATKALCGKVFVPRQAPDDLAVCPTCCAVRARMPE
ncbi:DUF3039 domain-containing protein [Tsukamurella pulmonis]|uniref:DUF3039 domain-containing protein n=1 Tax=Tsukamurella pulmonis TaxID=47312 RepID=UPI000E09A8B8|nr:DUF3039 domain-containing protein [Tsukamurella pulmonis]RDH13872.1 DUF3039 domain-containing protein [Tsukamurella pulmonis]